MQSYLAAAPILYPRRMNAHRQQISHRIDRNMAFSTFNLFTRVKTSLSASSRCLYRLCINNGLCRLSILPDWTR